jgi:hypothetical protein
MSNTTKRMTAAVGCRPRGAAALVNSVTLPLQEVRAPVSEWIA